MNTQKIVIVVGIIILLIIGWWSFGNNSAEAPNEDITSTENDSTNTEVTPRTNNTGPSSTNSGGTATNNPGTPTETPATDNSSTLGEDVEEMNGPEVTVRYTTYGFYPQNIIIEAGTTVTFVNESTSDMWVASDNHPSHTILPSFDQGESVTRGGSYSYTFNKIGAWGFHNHERPEHKGLVNVR